VEAVLSLTRSILVVFLPGTVAAAPWLLFVVAKHPALGLLYTTYPVPAHVVAVTIVILLGAISEGIATYVEKRWDDMDGADDEPESNETWLEKDWYDYLTWPFGDREPVGYRYLSRKATELYFFLSLLIATPIGLLGLGFLADTVFVDRRSLVIIPTTLAILAFIAGFRKLAKDTHCVLFNARNSIMKRLRPRPL